MMAAKTAIATTGHNVANASTEGYSRQRVHQQAQPPRDGAGGNILVGQGTHVSRVERMNDEYLEKQVRGAGRDLAQSEEKDILLRQTEDIFNEMNGDGLNRLVAKFFNEFRKLGNEPDNEAVRQSVREATNAMANDFKRLRSEVDGVRRLIDARVEGSLKEVNALAEELKDLNVRIKTFAISGASPNDLLDRRDMVLRELGSHMDLSMHKDNEGNYFIDIKGVGPLVMGPEVAQFKTLRSQADEQGKPENALTILSTASAGGDITHQIRGGKLGALLEVRDQTLSTIMNRLDEMAYTVGRAVNAIHSQGFNRHGATGINFFKHLDRQERAAEFLELSDEVKASINNIAAAAMPDAPGDNRIAIAISGLQSMQMMNEGRTTLDDFYNSIVSDVGVASARNRSTMNQTRDIQTQLRKMREQLSGVSIDEETANLLQFQHAFDASAKVIQVADEMLKTILDLKR